MPQVEEGIGARTPRCVQQCRGQRPDHRHGADGHEEERRVEGGLEEGLLALVVLGQPAAVEDVRGVCREEAHACRHLRPERRCALGCEELVAPRVALPAPAEDREREEHVAQHHEHRLHAWWQVTTAHEQLRPSRGQAPARRHTGCRTLLLLRQLQLARGKGGGAARLALRLKRAVEAVGDDGRDGAARDGAANRLAISDLRAQPGREARLAHIVLALERDGLVEDVEADGAGEVGLDRLGRDWCGTLRRRGRRGRRRRRRAGPALLLVYGMRERQVPRRNDDDRSRQAPRVNAGGSAVAHGRHASGGDENEAKHNGGHRVGVPIVECSDVLNLLCCGSTSCSSGGLRRWWWWWWWLRVHGNLLPIVFGHGGRHLALPARRRAAGAARPASSHGMVGCWLTDATARSPLGDVKGTDRKSRQPQKPCLGTVLRKGFHQERLGGAGALLPCQKHGRPHRRDRFPILPRSHGASIDLSAFVSRGRR